MSWTKLKRGEHNRIVKTVNVRITSVGYPKPRMVMRVARSLAAAAGFPVTEASRAHVLVGADEDAGWVKIETNPEGDWFCECRGKNEALKIVSPAPAGAPDAMDTTKCEGETSDGAVKFRMPWVDGDTARPTPAVAACTTNAATPATASVSASSASASRADEEIKGSADAVRDWCAEREVKTSKPKPPAEKPKKPPAAPPIKPPTTPAMRTFRHGSESVALSEKHHAIAAKLYAARKKGFLVYADLMSEAKTSDVETIRGMVSTLRKQLDPLGLAIHEIQKMGYQMKESLEPAGAPNGAEA